MSGSSAASTAAGEILSLIEKLKKKYKDDPKALEALAEVESKAKKIQTMADDGCY